MNSLSSTISQPPINRLWFLSTILFFTICSDQITKHVARNVLAPSEEIHFFSGLVKMSLVENHGGFLGIVGNLPTEFRFFFLNIGVALLLFGCLIYLVWFSGQSSSRTRIPLTIITGGGLSNLLDRLLGNGGVTDFLVIGTGYLQTGIFNLADVFILSGSFFLGFHLLRRSANHLR
ncbi:MAG: signal peptidase II [Pseudomonadota bacterium]